MDLPTETFPSIYSPHSKVYHDLHHREIRLIKLLRGRWSEKIHCQLEHVPLVNRPAYKALSYAWGSPRATRPILVNGHQHPVTVNLECALRRIRRVDSDLTLWVDALCINQSNNPERTEQVTLMHDIFSFTEEVIVYLGEVPHVDSDALDRAASSSATRFYYDERDKDKIESFRCRCIAKTVSGRKSRLDYPFEIFCFLRVLSAGPDLNHFPAFDSQSRQFIDTKYQRNLFEGLRQLMLCRWWNRIWVIQEVIVPKKVTMVYGSASAPWEMFVDASDWDSRNRSSSSPLLFPHEYSTVLAYFSRVVQDIDRMRSLWRTGKQSELLPLLRRFSGRKASDDRDKIYGLLSLARDHTSIVPDYSLSVPEVFQATVLDIISSSGSLTALAGDLGRKDRRDLPSWVPDWSASYDDFDRRRADRTDKYNASDGCVVYVQDEGANEWTGISQFISKSPGEEPVELRDYRERPTIDAIKVYSDFLGNSDWVNWLPRDIARNDVKDATFLAAISNFKNARGEAVCLQNHGKGVVALSGRLIDSVVSLGETALSDDEILPVVRSWAALARLHFADKAYDTESKGVGDAFRRMLCADIVENDGLTRRMEDNDHSLVANWFFQGNWGTIESRELLWSFFFKDIQDRSLYESPGSIDPSIDAAIRSATARRTFFITSSGYIGLGPPKMRLVDHLCILLGGQTPFILRAAGSRKVHRIPNRPRLGNIKRDCFEVIGDCYAHVLMDGEGMEVWRAMSEYTKTPGIALREELNRWEETYLNWEKQTLELASWKVEIDKENVLRRMRSHRGYNPLTLDADLQRCVERDGDKKKRVEAEIFTADVSTWKHQFGLMGDLEWMAELLHAAAEKMQLIQDDVSSLEREMDTLLQSIGNIEMGYNNSGRIFLV